MQRNVTILGLITSVGLLIAVFIFALKNSALFIEGFDAAKIAGVNQSGLDNTRLAGAKVSGAVVESTAVQIRESAKIRQAEIAALKHEQWLQQASAETGLTNDMPLNSEREFAPELFTVDQAAAGGASAANLEASGMTRQTKNVHQREQLLDLQTLQSMSFADIRFQFGQLTLSEKALQKIAEVAAILKANPRINAKIKNYTDSYGDNNFNLDLSRQRAKRVYDAFLNQGVNKAQLSFEGLGENDPVTSNATLAGRKQNRRTEIQFFEAN